jgi:hypothetical protein
VAAALNRAFHQDANMSATLTLNERELSFLRESNAIEDIDNVDYSRPENRRAGAGHVGAFVQSQELARRHAALTEQDVCRWQGMIAEEQLRFGHSIPRDGIGRLRSVDVRVGSHIAPPFSSVPDLFKKWSSDLYDALASQDRDTIELLGDYFQRFEAIHPFVDGNGRTGRLVANYIAAFAGIPIIVFRASERPAFYAAHRSKMAMRCFMADKYREAMYVQPGVVAERSFAGGYADVYPIGDGNTLIFERHPLIERQRQWAAIAAAKDEGGSDS